MKTILVFNFLFLIIFNAFSQNCNYELTGKVSDFHNGSVLPNAIVQIKSLGIGSETDSEGNFQLSNLCEGTYEVDISHPECKSIIRSIAIGKNTDRNFRLEHHAEELNQILLTGENFKDQTVPQTTLNSEVLERYSGANLGDALKEISGVSSLNTGSNIVKPVIHGLHSSRILILNNNVRMQDQQWGVEHAPNIDINSASSLKVIKGAAALQYGGDAVGGVIRVMPSIAPVKDTLIGNTILNASSNGMGGSITANILKARETGFYWKAQGTFKRLGDVSAPDYILSNTGVQERDFSVGIGLNKFDYKFDAYYSFFNTHIGILRASHLGNVSDLARAINNGDPLVLNKFTYNINAPRQDVQHHLAKTSFSKNFYGTGELELQYSFQFNKRKEFDIRRGEQTDRASLDLELMTHNFKGVFNLDQGKSYESKFGVDLTYQNNFANPDTGVRRLIPDYDMIAAGVFLLGNYYITDDFKVDAGIRYDYNSIDAKKFYLKSRWEERNYNQDFSNIIIRDEGSQWLTNPRFTYHNFSATAGTNFNLASWLKGSFNLSAASRTPNPSELFSDGLHHSAAIIELGDLSLQPEQAYKAALGIESEGERSTFLINPFINYIHNFILLEPSGIEQTIRGAFPVHEYKQVDAQIMGIDLNANYQISDQFTYSATFAYVHGTDINNNRPIIEMPAPQWSNKISYKNEKLKDLKLSLSNDIVFRQNRFPNNDFVVNVPQDGELIPTLIQISTPPAGYHLLHFNSQMKFTINTPGDFGVGFSINNIFNTPYRDYLNRQRYYADDLGRNFLIQFNFNY